MRSGRLEGGLFVTLYDKETLDLYLSQGVYGQHLPVVDDFPSHQSSYYPTLADYGCVREGTHVFFFLDRTIYYAGKVKGESGHGSFLVNGPISPMGRMVSAPLVWDEAKRSTYHSTGIPGLFATEEDFSDDGVVCQPFLIEFQDEDNFAGNYIRSDELYFELGAEGHPLPSNSIRGMGFCTMTPGEVTELMYMIREREDGTRDPDGEGTVRIDGVPVAYRPNLGINHLSSASHEPELEASITANPYLLPDPVQPPDGAVICRQVPMSPAKPDGIDKADLCYYHRPLISNGMIPNHLIELKNTKAGKGAALQVDRYVKWIERIAGDDLGDIEVSILAPEFTGTFEGYLSADRELAVRIVTFDGASRRV